MSRKKSYIREAGPFFVENLTGNSREEGVPHSAVLEIGLSNPLYDNDECPLLTCTVMEAEIDYEVDQLIKHLEHIRKEAKKLVAEHKADDQKYFAKNRLSLLADN